MAIIALAINLYFLFFYLMDNFNSPDPVAEVEGLEDWNNTHFDEDGKPIEPSED